MITQSKRSAQPCREKVRKGFKELMLQLEFAIWMREKVVPGRGGRRRKGIKMHSDGAC